MVASLVDTSLGDGTSVSETASANAPTPSPANTTKSMTSPRTQCRFGFDLRALERAAAAGFAARFAGLRGVLTMTSLTGKAQVGQMRADLGLHEITGGW